MKSDTTVRYTKGTGPGGQHKNKVATCVVLTHNPTGTTVRIDGRKRSQNERRAWKELARRLDDLKRHEVAAERKERRDVAIKNRNRIRTYDYSNGIVYDHRTGKKASIKDVLQKGKLELLR